MRMTAGVAAAFLLTAGAGFTAEPAVYDVPSAGRAPVIDGAVAPGEWEPALRIVGAGTPVDARRAEIAFAWDAAHLYVCATSETAPRNRLATSSASRPGTTRIVMDDSLELWFDPPKTLRNADETKRFGSFQLIVNHRGDTYGCHHNPGYGLPARDWKLDAVKRAWSVTNDTWTIELAFPASAFGLAAFTPFDLPLLAVRNFRLQHGIQAPFLRPGGGFMDAAHYPTLRLSRSATGRTVDRRPDGLAPFVWNTPEANIVAEGGRRDGDIAPYQGAGGSQVKGGRRDGAAAPCKGLVKGVKIPVPGAILLRTKTAGKMTKKGWRRYFSTAYRPSGYFGFQEDTQNGRALLFFAHHFKDAPAVNRRLRCPADGRDAVLAVNFEPKKITYYLNGVKQGETDLPMDLTATALGDLTLGGGAEGLDIKDWTLYRRTLSDAEVKAFSQGDTPVTGTLAWYPSINALVADVTCNGAVLACPSLAWRVTRRGEADAPPLATGGLTLADGFGGGELTLLRKRLQLGVDLPEGDYIAALTRPGEDDALLEAPFTVRRYAWFGNDLGKEDRLLPGFTPVAADGPALRCVGRVYEIGANGFPARITADGEQILAAPLELRAEKGGRRWRLAGRGGVTSRTTSATRAEYAAAGDGYTVKGSLEQDGLLRFTVDFARTPDADRVWLDIPLKKEYATLFHACGEGVRANPAGFVPAGTGVVFKSRDIPQTHVSNFIPYCWVGTDTRGICYAADTDLGWAHGTAHDAVEILRGKDGTVAIRLNLLNAPFAAGGARSIELALMASPVKPMPKGWRGWADGFGYGGRGRTSCALASPPYWGNYTGWASRYPAWADFGYVRKLDEAVRTGTIDMAYVNAWIDRVCASDSDQTAWVNGKTPKAKRDYVRAHTLAAFYTARGLFGKDNPTLYFYTCDADSAARLAEYPAFRGEWAQARVSVPSYADYAIWYLDRMVEAGMRGVYDDNTFICCNFNWATGEAKVDAEGKIHPSFGIWNCREYRRRQANVLVAHGHYPWITVHHTNGNILPVLGFASNSMGMEWKYGPGDFQPRFSPDYIRAVCQGLQGGLYPTVLDGLTGLGGREKSAERTRVTRTMLASLLVHEVRPTLQRGSDAALVRATLQRLVDWGVGEEDCVYTAYWDGANPVSVSSADVLVSVYRRGSKLLAVCANWAPEAREAWLTVKGLSSATDAETGAALAVSGGTVTLSLERHGFALLELDR